MSEANTGNWAIWLESFTTSREIYCFTPVICFVIRLSFVYSLPHYCRVVSITIPQLLSSFHTCDWLFKLRTLPDQLVFYKLYQQLANFGPAATEKIPDLAGGRIRWRKSALGLKRGHWASSALNDFGISCIVWKEEPRRGHAFLVDWNHFSQ